MFGSMVDVTHPVVISFWNVVGWAMLAARPAIAGFSFYMGVDGKDATIIPQSEISPRVHIVSFIPDMPGCL